MKVRLLFLLINLPFILLNLVTVIFEPWLIWLFVKEKLLKRQPMQPIYIMMALGDGAIAFGMTNLIPIYSFEVSNYIKFENGASFFSNEGQQELEF